MAAINTLPRHSGPALALPDATALAEFVFRHNFVQQWAAAPAKGRITKHHMPEQAAGFWSQLRHTVMNASPPRTLQPCTGLSRLHAPNFQP